MVGLKVDQQKALRMASAMQRWAVSVEGEDPLGSHTRRWARRLVKGLEQWPVLRSLLLENADGVALTLVELEKRSGRHGTFVDMIERQHRAVRDGADVDMSDYSEASAYMGREWWVSAAHARVAQWVDEFFLLTADQARRGHRFWAFRIGGLPDGWKRYQVGERVMYWNPQTKRMQLEAPAHELMPARVPPPSREPPVALLDVGSNSNPFLRYPYLVTPTAIDLCPAPDSEGVLQADFFEVPIVSADSAPPGERVVLGADGKLEGIVAGSFDVVVISLVLSYVPDPKRRIEMIARARRCLREDRGLLIVLEVASVLAETSWYHGDAAAEWTKAMEGAGFVIKKFNDTIQECVQRRAKKHAVLQWVLETAPVTDKPLQPLVTPKEMKW